MSKRRKGTGCVVAPQGRNSLYIKFTIQGKTYTESAHTTNRQQAEIFLRKRLGEMDEGVSIDARRVTFTDLAILMRQDYILRNLKTLPDMESRMENHVLPFFGKKKAVDITSADLKAYQAQRKAEFVKPSRKAKNQHVAPRPVSDAEINRELADLHRCFVLGKQHGLIQCDPPYCEKFKEVRKRTSYWRESEFTTLLSKLPESLHSLMRFFYFTGWRRSEVTGLQWRNVDFQAREIRLDPGTTKSGEPRIFPFIPEVEEILVASREKTVAHEKAERTIIPWVFHRDGKQIKDFRRQWYKALKSAGFYGKKVHDFRSTALRYLVRLGFTLDEARKMVGWESPGMVNYYMVTDSRDLHEAAERLYVAKKEEKQ